MYIICNVSILSLDVIFTWNFSKQTLSVKIAQNLYPPIYLIKNRTSTDQVIVEMCTENVQGAQLSLLVTHFFHSFPMLSICVILQLYAV